MIEVKSVSKTYGKKGNKFTALNGVNLKIPDGATVAITGKSGSGKSTLMHVISGLDRPTRGAIIINGQDIAKLKPKAVDHFRASEMSFIFQSFFVEPKQSCYQNVMLPLEIADIHWRKRKSMVRDALEKVELLDKINEKAVNLSGGQKQRLAIARAIVNNPRLIFADEPTGNLDSVTGETVMKLLFDMNKKLGATLIIVTHDEELATRCKLQISLKDGRVLSEKKNKRGKK